MAQPETRTESPVEPVVPIDPVEGLSELKPGQQVVLKAGDKIVEVIPHKPPCEYCGSVNSRVYKTVGVRRYRTCGGCGRSFSTTEKVNR